MSFRFYPIVDSFVWVQKLIDFGCKTIQLRIKNMPYPDLYQEIQKSVVYAKSNNCNLIINDAWQIALETKAFGVHLGFEDAQEACKTNAISVLQNAGVYLGLSTHDDEELNFAQNLNPSYIALGPIFPTTTKAMRFAPQGYEKIALWRKRIPNHIPLVAIGGIKLEHAATIYKAGADCISVISDIRNAEDPRKHVQEWLKY